jgi:hypothetical protein
LAQKPINYNHLAVVPEDPKPPELQPEPELPPSDLLRDVAQQFVIYMSPAAHKTIAEFALAKSSFRHKVRPHDLWIEAMEDYFAKHGLKGPVRAKDPPKPKVRRGALL